MLILMCNHETVPVTPGLHFRNSVYTMSQKVCPLMSDNNFSNCGPIFETGSPGDS